MIGLIGKKLGTTQIFKDEEVIPVSVIKAEPNIVIQKKTMEKDGYEACVLGAGIKKKPNKPYSGVFKKINVQPTQILKEVRNPPQDWKVGEKISVEIFTEGSKVNITGYSKGRGFTGVMKRYGWSGGKASHGSKSHRKPGAIGMQGVKKVFKGHKLPGRKGYEKITIKNVTVIKVDKEKNLLFIKGTVPGPVNSWVMIKAS